MSKTPDEVLREQSANLPDNAERIDISVVSDKYKVQPYVGGAVAVIYISNMPARMQIYRTVFYGPEAEERAREYAKWKNQS
jgi:hypothetical protein